VPVDHGDEVARRVAAKRRLGEMRVFSPGAFAWSMRSTRSPRAAAWIAHIMPAAPAPRISVSTVSLRTV
jgi:hypothetical protein